MPHSNSSMAMATFSGRIKDVSVPDVTQILSNLQHTDSVTPLICWHHRHAEPVIKTEVPWSDYLNVECISTIQKLFTKSVRWGVTSKSYQAADILDVHEEKLFSAMCNWSNHCLHHLLPSERDTGHDLRRRGNSYQLNCYNFSSTRHCFVIRMLYDSLH